jgi:hypothetical protein
MKKILIGNIILSIELEPLYIDDIQTTFVLNLSQIIRRLTFFDTNFDHSSYSFSIS